MKVSAILILAVFLIAAVEIIPNVQAGGIDWNKVDPLCTVSCGGYWLCMAKSSDCKRPKNCVCEEFAGR